MSNLNNTNNINNINNIHLKDLLEFLGEKVVRHGRNTFRLDRHDSLIIRNNLFYWNSRGFGGNSIKLLQSLYDYDYAKSKAIINEFIKRVEKGEYKLTEYAVDEKKEYKLNKLKKNSFSIIKEYLCDKRGLDENFVKGFVDRGGITIDIRNNINFMIRDDDHNDIGQEIIKREIIGREIVGTQESNEFRANSTIDKGFTIYKNEPDKKTHLFIFESAIDMLSYIEINKKNINEKFKDESIRFLSLSGLKEMILENYIDNVSDLYCCVDNDKWGNEFSERIKEKYSHINFHREKPKNKDFNDDLREIKNIKKEREIEL